MLDHVRTDHRALGILNPRRPSNTAGVTGRIVTTLPEVYPYGIVR